MPGELFRRPPAVRAQLLAPGDTYGPRRDPKQVKQPLVAFWRNGRISRLLPPELLLGMEAEDERLAGLVVSPDVLAELKLWLYRQHPTPRAQERSVKRRRRRRAVPPASGRLFGLTRHQHKPVYVAQLTEDFDYVRHLNRTEAAWLNRWVENSVMNRFRKDGEDIIEVRTEEARQLHREYWARASEVLTHLGREEDLRIQLHVTPRRFSEHVEDALIDWIDSRCRT